MDLIGSINYLENRLGRRKQSHGKGKSAQKNASNIGGDEKVAQTDSDLPKTEYDTRLGRKIDITV